METLSFSSDAALWRESFVLPILQWYDVHARTLPWRSDPTPYRVWVSEIMLQQTRVEPALPYFERFMHALPTPADLADCAPDRLNKLWEGLGYYARARNMQKAAQMLLDRFGGRFPQTLQELTALPGVGEYTAGAILSIAFSQPVPAVDGNVMRVLARQALYEEDITLPRAKKAFTALVFRIIPHDRPGDFNQALMDLGAAVCRPNGAPLCESCPVNARCAARAEELTDRLPVRPAKKARRVQERTVLLIRSERGVLLRRRPPGGLLAGMWEFPSLEGKRGKKEIEVWFKEQGHGAAVSSLANARHVFTHLEWRMSGYLIRCGAFAPKADEVWASSKELGARYAVPSAFKTYAALAEKLDEEEYAAPEPAALN